MVGASARWALRDWLAAAGFFIATGGIILWQNAHVAVLWDLSYILDTATRIALGQMPYRYFPLAHAPLTFLIQAAIIRLTGRVFFHHVLYAAIVGGLSTVLTWRIVLRILQEHVSAAWPIALILTAPLTVLGVYCIFPLPSYDCDCTFATLVAIWLLVSLEPQMPRTRFWRAILAGASLCLPLFFKQNIGLPFLIASVSIIILALAVLLVGRAKPDSPANAVLSTAAALPTAAVLMASALKGNDFSRAIKESESIRTLGPEGCLSPACADAPSPDCRITTLLFVLAGAAVALLLSTLLIHFTFGLGNYVHWTIDFAAQRRLPSLQRMLSVYNDPQLLWTVPCIAAGLILLRGQIHRKRRVQFLALALLAAPFVYTLCASLIYDDPDKRGDILLALWPMLLILSAALAFRNLRCLHRGQSLQALLLFVLLAAIHGTLMSQQLWGSTYAIWPLLILLVAEMIAYLANFKLPGIRSRIFEKGPAPLMAALVAVTLLCCGAFYTISEERLSYAQFLDASIEHSAFPQLKGLSASGPFLANFDELLRYAASHIPRNNGILLIPGEDPFYFATGRVPQFPVLLFDPATDPYSPEQVAEEARSHNIRWLIIKRDLQIDEDPTPQREATINTLLCDFTPSAHLHGYDIYYRR